MNLQNFSWTRDPNLCYAYTIFPREDILYKTTWELLSDEYFQHCIF